MLTHVELLVIKGHGLLFYGKLYTDAKRCRIMHIGQGNTNYNTYNIIQSINSIYLYLYIYKYTYVYRLL